MPLQFKTNDAGCFEALFVILLQHNAIQMARSEPVKVCVKILLDSAALPLCWREGAIICSASVRVIHADR